MPSVGGDEDGLELRVFFALHDRHDLPPERMLRLHEGETAEPCEIDLLVGQRFDGGGVVGDRGEFHFGAKTLLQVFHERRGLARELGGRLVGNGGDAKHLLGLCRCAQGQQPRTSRSRRTREKEVEVMGYFEVCGWLAPITPQVAARVRHSCGIPRPAPPLLERLRAQCSLRAPLFAPEAERAALLQLLQELHDPS